MSDEPIIVTKTIDEENLLKFTKSILWIRKEYPYLDLKEAYINDDSGKVSFIAKFAGEFKKVEKNG